MAKIVFQAELTGAGTENPALWRAEDILREHGFSIGSETRSHPSAIMHGDCFVPRWGMLTPKQRASRHGEIYGWETSQIITITLFGKAPIEVVRRLLNSLDGADYATILVCPRLQ